MVISIMSGSWNKTVDTPKLSGGEFKEELFVKG